MRAGGSELSSGGASCGETVKTRDPDATSRDPSIEARKPRKYIAANMPTVCPSCGHSTRMDNGRHIDQVRRRILEYRTCSKCRARLLAARPMTAREAETLCVRAEAIAEYEAVEVRHDDSLQG